ncbi:MAG: ribonuclease PH [Anaerolineae bacterium]|jgi:ribonuclease PH|nr:ribonuclease PH [Anaerolineae bacterium]MDH7474979.1 ribonuclease PH [Anaerolineae bacterium]
MRIDGRSNDALRPVTIIPDYIAYPEGSVLIEVGNTRVLCNVTVEDTIPAWLRNRESEQGWLTAEYALLPRSTHTRTPRETGGLRGRTQEIRRFIGRSLRAAVDLPKLGPRTIIVDCDVLQADGGTRTAAVTGGYVAVALALQRLAGRGVLPPDVLREPVAAVSVGVVNGEHLLDLCYAEDAIADVDVNVVMAAGGDYVEVQGTAEGRPFGRTTLEKLLNLAEKGIRELLAIQARVM